MGFFSDLNKKLIENIYAHSSYLTDPSADLPRRVKEIVDLLMPFIQPEAREEVRLEILGIIHEHMYDEVEIEDSAAEK
ncbi:hypothetical protein ABID26_003939 [Mesorhizobium shonense]|uniref:Uncharacterized protein n=1 Tax=Mesorhizobium shonense TaxID=1209948 RepID=A0ABV2HV89_9HYPH|nr:hypothetical protein [Mesorhizobium sp.]TIS46252.1 MAG: hypothetical protein E5W96_28205 [Mesorhizobium sp.]